MISQVGVVGRKNISQPSLKTSNPLLLSLIKVLQCRSSILIQSPRILRPRRSRPQSMHPHCLSLPKKFLSTSWEMRTWERFTMAVTDMDVSACYNMSLKDFEHSGVHDLIKVSFFFFFFLYVYISSLTNDADIYLTKL